MILEVKVEHLWGGGKDSYWKKDGMAFRQLAALFFDLSVYTDMCFVASH